MTTSSEKKICLQMSSSQSPKAGNHLQQPQQPPLLTFSSSSSQSSGLKSFKNEEAKIEELCHVNFNGVKVKEQIEESKKSLSNALKLEILNNIDYDTKDIFSSTSATTTTTTTSVVENIKSEPVVVVVRGSGRRKKSHPVRQIVNTCVVAYSELPNPNANNNPVDLSNKVDTATTTTTSTTTTLLEQKQQPSSHQQQQQQQQPVILSVPHYNPGALESGTRYNLPSTTITLRSPGKNSN